MTNGDICQTDGIASQGIISQVAALSDPSPLTAETLALGLQHLAALRL